MQDLHCPFSQPITTGLCGCRHALEVTRRGGAETACQDQSMFRQCRIVAERLKENILPALGFENDLLQVPHSMLQKVMVGGLNGLNHLAGNTTDRQITDISVLIGQVFARVAELSAADCEKLAQEVRDTRLRRRRRSASGRK